MSYLHQIQIGLSEQAAKILQTRLSTPEADYETVVCPQFPETGKNVVCPRFPARFPRFRVSGALAPSSMLKSDLYSQSQE